MARLVLVGLLVPDAAVQRRVVGQGARRTRRECKPEHAAPGRHVPPSRLLRVRTLIVGHGGRESALAMRMAEHSELHAVVGHENPSILARCAEARAAATRSATSATRGRSPPSRASARSTSRWSAPTSRSRRGSSTRCSRRARAPSGPTRDGRGDRVEQGVRPRAARRGRARGGAARCASSATRPRCDEAIEPLRRDAGRGQAGRADRRQGRQGDGPAPRRPRRGARRTRVELLARGGAGRVGADRGADRRRRVHDPGDQRRRARSCSRPPPTTTPTASTATRGRAPAGWARCRCPSPTLPFMTAAHYRAGVLDHRARDRAPRRAGPALQRRHELAASSRPPTASR